MTGETREPPMLAQKCTEAAGLLLSDDFLWISRITGTAQALGLQITAVRTMAQLEQRAREEPPRCVILDLDLSHLVPGEVVQRLEAICPIRPRFTAFGSHVEVASLRAARAAGCDPVLPRSKMAEELPALLKEWLGSSS
jgi:CheY-like chemotaxis protein